MSVCVDKFERMLLVQIRLSEVSSQLTLTPTALTKYLLSALIDGLATL